MTETNDTEDRKPGMTGRKLNLRRSTTETVGRVRQNFSHGRTKPVVVEIQDDEQAGVFEASRGRHPQSQGTGAGDHDHIIQLDLAALYGVDRAGQWLDEGGMGK